MCVAVAGRIWGDCVRWSTSKSILTFPVPRAESVDEQFAHLLEYSIINRARFPVRVLRVLIFSETRTGCRHKCYPFLACVRGGPSKDTKCFNLSRWSPFSDSALALPNNLQEETKLYYTHYYASRAHVSDLAHVNSKCVVWIKCWVLNSKRLKFYLVQRMWNSTSKPGLSEKKNSRKTLNRLGRVSQFRVLERTRQFSTLGCVSLRLDSQNRKRIFSFFTKQINPRSLRSKSLLRVNSSIF